MSYVMPRIVILLFIGRDCPLKVTRGCELDSCLSKVKRVI